MTYSITILILSKEMDRALKEIHVDYISTEQVKKLIEVCVTKILYCY